MKKEIQKVIDNEIITYDDKTKQILINFPENNQ